MKILSTGMLLALTACASVPRATGAPPAPLAPGVRVEQAWVRAAQSGQPETWAFATITNSGPADAIEAIRSPDAGDVVLRATSVTDAGRKTRSVSGIPLPARGTLTLTADTYFIAFIRLKHAFLPGHMVTGSVRFSSGAIVPVEFRVAEASTDPADEAN